VTGDVEIWTDGSCLVNPNGPGGWAAIVVTGDTTEELAGGDPSTTNNRMELTAVLRGLEHAPAGSTVSVTSDSQYVVKGLTSWRHGWRRNGWRKRGGEAVLNADLWKALDSAVARHATVTATWVRGHNGDPKNDRADRLAGEQALLARDGAQLDDPAYDGIDTWDLLAPS
jgi:ribonuclease HI